MKKVIPNKLINPQTIEKFEKSNVPMRIKVLLLLMFVNFCTNMFAQARLDNSDTPEIKELSTYLNSQRAMRLSSSNTYSDATYLEKIISEVQPSVYFFGGEVKTYGEKPKNLFTDLSSLSQLSHPNIQKNNVEIIIISINNNNDLNRTLDMSLFSNYKNLKYILITSKVSVNENIISSMLRNYNSAYSIYFKVDNKDTNQ